MKINKKFKKAFTLVELVVVIAVIAILSAVSVGAYFGITDSANSSAAEQYKKQVKDIWTMFTVSDGYTKGTSDDIARQNAEEFCLTYAQENGPQNVAVNYKLVDVNPLSDVKALKNSTFTDTGVMFFIDSNYDSYFVTIGEKIYFESNLIKSEDDFKNLMNDESTSFMSNEDRDLFKTLGFDAFELSNVGTEEEPVYGYKYFVVNVDGNVPGNNILVQTNRSLASVKEEYKPNDVGYKPSSGSEASYFGKTYEILENGVEIDTTVPFTHEHQSPVLIEGNKYSVGTINLTYKSLIDDEYVNLFNFPVCDYANGKATYFKNFLDFKSEALDKADPSDTAEHYIFVGNTSLNTNLTLPSNYNLVVEYSINATSAESTSTNIASMQSFISLGYNKDNLKDTIQNGRFEDSPASCTPFLSKISILDRSFKIESGVILEVNGTLLNEGYSHVANGNRSSMITKACHIELEKDSEIILNSNSTLRTLGVIDGQGSIIAKNGSKVIEPFKITSFLGGTVTLKVVGNSVFPFMDYHIDNLRVTTKFEKGSSYGALAQVNMSQNVFSYVPFFGDGALFNALDENSYIQKSYDTNSSRTILNIVGNITDSPFIINIGGTELNSTSLNFPITNMEITVSEKSTLNLSAYTRKYSKNYYSHYEFMPTSSLINNGTININNQGNKLVIANIQEYDLSGATNPVAKKAASVFSNLKDNLILFNNGLISGGLYSYKDIDGFSKNSNSYELQFLHSDNGDGLLGKLTCKLFKIKCSGIDQNI